MCPVIDAFCSSFSRWQLLTLPQGCGPGCKLEVDKTTPHAVCESALRTPNAAATQVLMVLCLTGPRFEGGDFLSLLRWN